MILYFFHEYLPFKVSIMIWVKERFRIQWLQPRCESHRLATATLQLQLPIVFCILPFLQNQSHKWLLNLKLLFRDMYDKDKAIALQDFFSSVYTVEPNDEFNKLLAKISAEQNSAEPCCLTVRTAGQNVNFNQWIDMFLSNTRKNICLSSNFISSYF